MEIRKGREQIKGSVEGKEYNCHDREDQEASEKLFSQHSTGFPLRMAFRPCGYKEGSIHAITMLKLFAAFVNYRQKWVVS